MSKPSLKFRILTNPPLVLCLSIVVPCVFTFLMYCVGKYVGHEGLTAFGSILLGMLYTFICLLFLATVFLFLVYAYYTLGGIAARHAVKHVSIQELESLSIEELKKLEYMTTSDTDVEARRSRVL